MQSLTSYQGKLILLESFLKPFQYNTVMFLPTVIFPGDIAANTVLYAEGIYVGYRYYDTKIYNLPIHSVTVFLIQILCTRILL
ncbi:hypothetical protein GCM10020331_075060 [Ectobacillus funiculus]